MSYSHPTGCNCLCHGAGGDEGDGDPCEACNDFHDEAETQASDDPVRELAETLVREVDHELDYERWPVSLVADRISTFLAEREASVARLARESVLSVVRAVRDERDGVLSPEAREILDRLEGDGSAVAEREAGWLVASIEDARHRSTEIPPWAKSANSASSDGDPMTRLAAHVITKIRTKGDRDGEVTSYLVGPVRGTREEAERDLAMFLQEGEREAGWMERQDRSATTQLKMVGRLAALRAAVEEAIDEIQAMSDSPNRGYSLRVMNGLEAVLASGAGEKEAEFIQAALDFHDSSDPMDETEKRFHEAADALRAARDGEGTETPPADPPENGWSLAEQMARDAAGEIEG